MREVVQLAQQRRAANVKSTLPSLGVRTETSCSSTVRLENPVGVFGASTVEAPSRAQDEKCGHAADSLGSIQARKLAKGAQEKTLQHRCAGSAQPLSPHTSNSVLTKGVENMSTENANPL